MDKLFIGVSPQVVHMVDLKKIVVWVLIVTGAFMMMDAFLAIVSGESYQYFGLDSMPVWYKALILNIYASPWYVLWSLMVLEFAAGFVVFQYARKLREFV